MRTPWLTVVCGLPGSGKTTLAKQLETQRGAVRMCPDDWMQLMGVDLSNETLRAKIESLQWGVTERLLQVGQSVIIEWGVWGREERDTLRLGARRLNASVELIYLTAPLEELFERIRRRGMESFPITWDELVSWDRIFQPPTDSEAELFDIYTGE